MIDLHLHTSYSDGKYSLKEVLKMAESKKLTTISITDHNVIDAYNELKNINVKDYYSGKIINGIEFDFVYKNKDFHILGYNFDVDVLKESKFIDRRTKEELIAFEEKNLEFFKSVCAKLNIKLSDNLKIKSTNEPANDIIKADMLSYKENNKIMDELLGKNREISFYLGHVTNPKSPFYIDFTKNLPTAKEIADEIHAAGGIVILAHPFEYKSIDNKKYIDEMYTLKILDGIEVVHTKHLSRHERYLVDYCKNKGLIMSGGSDFHDDAKQTMGYSGTGPIPEKYLLNKYIDIE